VVGKEQFFRISPVPANDFIQIQSHIGSRKVVIMVSDLTGKVILDTSFLPSENYRINVSHWDEGIYVLILSTEDIFETRKIVVLH